MINRDKFTQEEKNYIEELKEKKILTCKSRDLSPDEFEFHVRRVTKQVEKVFKILSLLVFVLFIFFVIAYIDDQEECGFMYPWFFVFCIVLDIYLYMFGHWWTHRHDKKTYEFKSIALKFNVVYYKGIAKNIYSIAEVMPDGDMRYFGIIGESQEQDKLYEGKMLLAEMIREAGQTRTMFEVDRKSFQICRMLDKP